VTPRAAAVPSWASAPVAGAPPPAAAGRERSRGELIAELSEVVAPHEARFIVDEVLGLGLVLGHPDPPTGELDADAVAAARGMAGRRAAGEPLQYVFGHWPFRELDLRVDTRVLIPRPETEQVVEVALAEARRLHAGRRRGGLVGGGGLVVADAGTGSGAIALALATELGPGLVDEVWATDTSADALAVAAANLAACRAARVGRVPSLARVPRVELAQGTWLTPLPERLRGGVDLVVSNPPYVSEQEWAGLAREVQAEPRQALVAADGRTGTPGAADVEAVLEACRGWLGRPGTAVVELAPMQAAPAEEWARQLGYDEVRVASDLVGRPRALVARLSGSQ
jgi:release factor glutamine methyltransferase